MIYQLSRKKIRTLLITFLSISSFFASTNAFCGEVECRFCALGCTIKCAFDGCNAQSCVNTDCANDCKSLSETEKQKIINEVDEEAKKK